MVFSYQLILKNQTFYLLIDSDFHKLRDDFPDVGDVDKIVENCSDLGQYANKVFGKNFIWSLNRLSKEFVSFFLFRKYFVFYLVIL